MKLSITLFSILFFATATAASADDYMQALNAEAAEIDNDAASIIKKTSNFSTQKTPLITEEIQDAFEQQLKTNYRASFYTFKKLTPLHQNKVIAFYLANGKSMTNISTKLLEQYSLQLKSQ